MSKAPTVKQNAARERNWQVRRLRGVWAQLGLLSASRAALARLQVDNELIDLGAEPEGVRRQRDITESDIPF